MPAYYLQGFISFIIDNSRTGLDTSNNQCSAYAVTAIKKIWTVSCLQLISTKELVKCIRLYNYHWLSYWKHHTILEKEEKKRVKINVLQKTVCQDLAPQRRKKN